MTQNNNNLSRETQIKEVVILLDRAMSELQSLGIDIPASYVAMAHDLLVERLFSSRARPRIRSRPFD